MNSQLILCATPALLCVAYAARYFYRRDSASSRMHRSLRKYVRQASTTGLELS